MSATVIAFPADEAPEALHLVAPGRYSATYIGHQGMTIYRTPKVRVSFRLMEHPYIVLDRWYRVNSYRNRIKARASSDLVRELSAGLNRRIRPDRVPVGELKGIIVCVRVRTVTTDHRQSELHSVNHYSVIEALEGQE